MDSNSNMPYSTISNTPPKRRAGRTKFQETRHPIYKGVRRRTSNSDRWVCEVREPNKKSRIWLGTFQTAEMAARAHDVAAMALRGKSACLNFADSAELLRVPEGDCPKEIRRAAVEGAEMFRPKDGAEGEVEGESSGNGLGVDLFCDGFELGEKDYWEMANGMLIDPPLIEEEEEDECGAEVALWSYSI